MTLHLRQPLPTAEFDTLIDEALSARSSRVVYAAYAKRAFDLLIVLILAIPVAFLVLVFAWLVSRDGFSPFYRQKRVGRNGTVFSMWKLRSMVPNADTLLEAYLADNADARAEWAFHQKLRHDPRITKIGRFIRKTSIDELPQLWNVLRGDMSIVGPRPMLENQRAIYPGTAYYALRPGITGYWQTSVRNESSFSERAGFDTDYLRDMSFLTDIRILLKTVRVVAAGTGY
ncbi:sugar transferase [Cognatishimia sp. F0-27]|uniref:sugar transferase n=1 Tax=Cognatishimia sp. F0-27 TaxID=2816855 RepID=UPI001D0C1973|nr:sugar transferase [Cognatishimia sp. F0-27]MCC1491297.1 sugar transferase [Cognatishimia sp. F0-27]